MNYIYNTTKNTDFVKRPILIPPPKKKNFFLFLWHCLRITYKTKWQTMFPIFEMFWWCFRQKMLRRRDICDCSVRGNSASLLRTFQIARPHSTLRLGPKYKWQNDPPAGWSLWLKTSPRTFSVFPQLPRPTRWKLRGVKKEIAGHSKLHPLFFGTWTRVILR